MIDALNTRFSREDKLTFTQHPSGLVLGNVDTSRCAASFFLHGSHLASFRPKSQSRDLIFMSSEAVFAGGKPIRGGVPICFPWFGAHPTNSDAPAHGLVRTVAWEMLDTSLTGDVVDVQLGLIIDELELRYEMRFGDELKLAFSARNLGNIAKSCELALHTYFNLADATRAVVTGLERCNYRDQLTKVEHPPSGEPIQFVAETDRVYFGHTDEIKIVDSAAGRTIVLRPLNSSSSVVWNPWIDKSKRLTDFGDDEYQRMCCIETARVTPNQLLIEPGHTETVAVTIGV